MIVSPAIQKMIEFYKGNLHDINHFLKVWAMAKTIGELEGLDAHAQEVLELMGRTQANHHFVPDIMRSIWIKYAGNVSNNLPQAIIGAGVGIYVVSSHAAYIAERLWNEVAALAALRGIDVGPFVPGAWAGRKTSRFSTLQDLDNRRHTEIDMLAGTAIRLSQDAGLSAPFCEFAYHAIKALEEKGDGKFNF